MGLEFYKLREQPFGAIPDRRFLFVGAAHRRALSSVLAVLQQGSDFVSLTAPAGVGKTTLLFHMFQPLKENVTTVYLFQAPQSPLDLLRALLADLGVREMEEIPHAMLEVLKELLSEQAARQKRVVVIIDEAQNLTPAVLELVWMLSHLEGAHGRMLQFVLSGQPQMADIVMPARSTQLTHRAPFVARLEPLSLEDTARYIDHRLRIAGYAGEFPLFTPAASALIARHSQGVPRKINNLCFSALSLGYKTKRPVIEVDVVVAALLALGVEPEPVATAPQTFLQLPASAEPVVTIGDLSEGESTDIGSRGEPGPDPAFVSFAVSTQTSSRWPGLLPKLGLVAAVLLAVSTTTVSLRRHVQALSPPPVKPGTVALRIPRHPSGEPVRVAQKQVVPPRSEHDFRGMDLNAAVRALNGRSLSEICKANFGDCNSKQLQEIHRVNLRLSDHAHGAVATETAQTGVTPD